MQRTHVVIAHGRLTDSPNALLNQQDEIDPAKAKLAWASRVGANQSARRGRREG
jgi:hypothetical protein